jgi:hypothetical protein
MVAVLVSFSVTAAWLIVSSLSFRGNNINHLVTYFKILLISPSFSLRELWLRAPPAGRAWTRFAA